MDREFRIILRINQNARGSPNIRMGSFRVRPIRLWIKPGADKVYRPMDEDDQDYEADWVEFGTHSLTTESVEGRVDLRCRSARSAVITRACFVGHPNRRMQPAAKHPIQTIESGGQQCEDRKRSNHVDPLRYGLHRALNKTGFDPYDSFKLCVAMQQFRNKSDVVSDAKIILMLDCATSFVARSVSESFCQARLSLAGQPRESIDQFADRSVWIGAGSLPMNVMAR